MPTDLYPAQRPLLPLHAPHKQEKENEKEPKKREPRVQAGLPVAVTQASSSTGGRQGLAARHRLKQPGRGAPVLTSSQVVGCHSVFAPLDSFAWVRTVNQRQSTC